MKAVVNHPFFSQPLGHRLDDSQVRKKSFADKNIIFWLLATFLTLWFCLYLGNRPLAAPDEGRYVEIPREMVVSGDYLTPRLNGVKYFEKPPLFYWLQAASIHLFGIQEWAMRLWCVFFAVWGCLGAYLFGRRFYGATSGIVASIVMATSPLYYALGRLIVLDMAITTFVSLAFFSFLTSVYTPSGWKRRLYAWSFYTFSALGIMVKGIMVLAISGPVILAWILWTRGWKKLWPAYLPSGILLFSLISVPWHILVSIKNPEFAHKYFIVEHFLRYTTSVHMRVQPFYFFIPVLLIGFFPWITLLWNAIKEKVLSPLLPDQKDISLFLFIWAGWTLLFFSFSNSKLIPYILPCFPPLAIIIGSCWTKLYIAKVPAWPVVKLFAFCTGSLGFTGLAVIALMPHLINHKPYLWVDLTMLAASMVLMMVLTVFFIYWQRFRACLALIPVTAIILVTGVIRLMPELQRTSLKPLAQIIQSIKKPEDLVGSYKSYYQDLPPYINQTVTVVGTRGELEFGCEAEDCARWMMSEEQFIELWQGSQRLLFVARDAEIADLVKQTPSFRYTLLARSQENILITNKEGNIQP